MCALQNWTSQVALSDPPADWSCHRRQPTDQKLSRAVDVVVVVVEVVAWIEHKCGGGFLSKKLHLEPPLPASEPASSKLKVCQLTVQGSSPPGQTSCFAAFGEQGCAANPVSGYPRKVVSHISRLDNEDYFHFLENNHLHTEISLCAPVSDSGNVVIANF